ncbi:MAG: hypothetical protein GEV04_12780 [Actinophytocola sp.]|nr:hypothetical protein [Actinophytocola sp.]
MASISKRDDDRADETEPAPWHERPVIGTSQGLPWWQAILLAFGLTLFAAVVDLQFNDKLTVLFQGAYFVACLAAVGWVRRDSLFGPMVQPPLILVVIVPGIMLFSSQGPKGSGMKDILLGYGMPVINGFPTMAITTGVTVAAGLARLFLQRDPDHAEADDDPDPVSPKSPLLDRLRKAIPIPGRDPDADREPMRGSEPGEPPQGRRGAESPAPGRRPPAPPGPGAAPPGRHPSGPTQRPPRMPPPERRPEAPGAGPPPPGRRRAPSEPVRRRTRGEAAEPPPRRAQPKPPPGSQPPPAGPPPAGPPPAGGQPPGGQPPRRRPSRPAPPPEDQPYPPRRQPPPRRRSWDPDQG